MATALNTLMSAATTDGTYGYLRVDDATEIHLAVTGTWNGATVTVKVSFDGGSNFVDLVADGAAVSMTDNNKIVIEAAGGERYAVAISNDGASTSLTAYYTGKYLTKLSTATG